MSMNLISKKTISLKSNPGTVWNALTNPSIIKEWLYGTDTITDWKEGSPIKFVGEWEGKKYEDKGTVLHVAHEKQVRYTYWSSMSGLEDLPQNYAHITYDLEQDGDQVLLTITQDNIAKEETKKHSDANWAQVLNKIKELVEKN
ncbi:MAG: SRPBCC domain-containing protein [Opitutaceae bacterium]|nr:SRPBCC domain-containing protein [Cytophagales bacterium]